MADQRRLSKQLMERQRRARINASLERLKEFLQLNRRVDADRLQRLEKADILELTVSLLQQSGCRVLRDGGGNIGEVPAAAATVTISAPMDTMEEASCGAYSVASANSTSSTESATESATEEDSSSCQSSAFRQYCGGGQRQCHSQDAAAVATADVWRRKPLAALENRAPMSAAARAQAESATAVWRPW